MAATLSSDRADALRGLLAATITGDVSLIDAIVTEDVSGWSPNLFVTSRKELIGEFTERQGALSNIKVSVDGLDVVHNKAIAEWRLMADHTGSMTLDIEGAEDVLIEPTGSTIVLAGATFADFDGDRICAFRHYFDDAALLEQLLGLV